MNADLTINTITFAKSFDTEDGSERRSSARGINAPDILAIKRRQITDSATKQPARQFVVSTDRQSVDAVTAAKYCTRVHTVFTVPDLAVQDDVDAVVATHRALLASTSPDYVAQILNSES